MCYGIRWGVIDNKNGLTWYVFFMLSPAFIPILLQNEEDISLGSLSRQIVDLQGALDAQGQAIRALLVRLNASGTLKAPSVGSSRSRDFSKRENILWDVTTGADVSGVEGENQTLRQENGVLSRSSSSSPREFEKGKARELAIPL